MKQPELNQCPCCPATKCEMTDPCLGCETYASWLNKSSNLAWVTRQELKEYSDLMQERLERKEP